MYNRLFFNIELDYQNIEDVEFSKLKYKMYKKCFAVYNYLITFLYFKRFIINRLCV